MTRNRGWRSSRSRNNSRSSRPATRPPARPSCRSSSRARRRSIRPRDPSASRPRPPAGAAEARRSVAIAAPRSARRASERRRRLASRVPRRHTHRSRPRTLNTRTGFENPFSGRSSTGSARTASSVAAQHPLADQDLPGGRRVAQARREVRHACRSRRSRSAPRSRSARSSRSPGRSRRRTQGRGRACCHSSASSPTRSRIATAIRTARSAGSSAGHRIVEEDHQAVAGEPLERALEREDQLPERGVVLAAGRPSRPRARPTRRRR